MKVLLQWAQRDPGNWIPFDLDLIADAWESLPTRAEPNPGQLGGSNNVLGWINNLMVQGVRFNGADHYAVEQVTIGLEAGTRVTIWNDNPDNWPVGQRHARIWTFLPLAVDANLGGAINTRQSQVLYAEGPRFTRNSAKPPQNTTVLPWANFVLPAIAITRHGVLLTKAKYAEHIAAQTQWGWRHWVDHLLDSEVVLLPDGRRELKTQRDLGRWKKAAGTITYFQRDTNREAIWIAATHEDALELTTAAAVSESVTVDVSSIVSWGFSSPANEPNSADWPNGTYRCQLDCTAASVGLTYQFSGTFFGPNRVSSDLVTDLEAASVWTTSFSGTGLKLDTGTFDFAAGDVGDRFAFPITVAGDSIGDAMTLRLNTADSFADGPWPGADDTTARLIDLQMSISQPIQEPTGVVPY